MGLEPDSVQALPGCVAALGWHPTRHNGSAEIFGTCRHGSLLQYPLTSSLPQGEAAPLGPSDHPHPAEALEDPDQPGRCGAEIGDAAVMPIGGPLPPCPPTAFPGRAGTTTSESRPGPPASPPAGIRHGNAHICV